MGNLSEPGLTAANVSFLYPSSIKEVSSLATVHHTQHVPFHLFLDIPRSCSIIETHNDESVLEGIDNEYYY
jgi:hypothetical protein